MWISYGFLALGFCGEWFGKMNRGVGKLEIDGENGSENGIFVMRK